MVQLFKVGQVYKTMGVNETIDDNDIMKALNRHVKGDWGELQEGDKEANDEALQTDQRILSSYKDSNGVKFWIITEADRSATTVLLPEEY